MILHLLQSVSFVSFVMFGILYVLTEIAFIWVLHLDTYINVKMIND